MLMHPVETAAERGEQYNEKHDPHLPIFAAHGTVVNVYHKRG
jgi:hypothetical protein